MSGNTISRQSKKRNRLKFTKWGYFFIAPFFIVYAIFSLYPLISTFYKSFFEEYTSGLQTIGPTFVGLDNYKAIFSSDTNLLKYFGNTLIIWVMGFIPQIIFSLLFAAWFTDLRLKLKATGFFKIVLYLPNILMASSVAVLFFTLFSKRGPVNDIIAYITNNQAYFDIKSTTIFNFFASVWATRGIAAFINFLMWVGNTTILLMAGIMGIDTSLYEAAQIDGASSSQTFRKIILPLLKPILLFVLVTSMIGGIQMFDIPQLLTGGAGTPNRTSTTVVMFLNNHLFSKNYGMAGAVSVVLFAVAALLSIIIFMMLTDRVDKKDKKFMKNQKKMGGTNNGDN